MRSNQLLKLIQQFLAGTAVAFVLGFSAIYGAEVPAQSGPAVWKVGSEIDLLPYATQGFYASGFVGRSGWKFRGVVARSTIPSFLVTTGFKDKRMTAGALLVDRFIGARRQKLEGAWIGGGCEEWRTRIRTEASPDFAYYNNFIVTGGGGYVWKLSKHFYVNPWAGAHFVAAGDRSVRVSGKIYTQPLFTPEGSVKFGFTF